MNAFTYSYPVKVYFGEKAAAKNLASELTKVGANVLLAYGGGSIKQNGVYDELMGILNHEGSSNGANALPTVEKLAVGATVKSDDALSIRGGKVDGAESDVRAWVQGLGY